MLRNGSYDRVRPLLREGTPTWAHWSYQPDEWQLFLRLDLVRLRRAYLSYGLLLMLVSMVGGAWLGSANWSTTDRVSMVFLVLLPTTVCAAAAGLLYLYFHNTEIWRTEIKSKPAEVVVTPLYVSIGDKKVPIVSPGLNLREVSIVQASEIRSGKLEILRFRVKPVLSRSPGYDIWVPIPRQKSAEGQQVLERFRTLVPWQNESRRRKFRQ
jgi:hypothetical protein